MPAIIPPFVQDSKMSVPDLITTLRTILPPHHLLTNPEDMAPYLTDWRGRYHGNARAVVLPNNVAAVSAIVRHAHQAGVPIVPQGGNTSLCGGATPFHDGSALLLNLSRLNRIREVRVEDEALIAEAGCTLSAVQAAAALVNRRFPVSLAAEGSSQIGGNLSTNAGGVHVVRYGMMRDWVLGLEVVLPNGEIWHGLRTLKKDNTGYALKHLFVGAEGTLGIITAASLKLAPTPRSRAAAWVTVPSVEAALCLLTQLRETCGDRLEAFELMGSVALNLVHQHLPHLTIPLHGQTPWSVLIELSDTWPNAPLEAHLTQALALANQRGWVSDAAIAKQLAEIDHFWTLREAIPEAQKREGLSIKHDIAVPPSQIATFLARADAALLHAFPGVRLTTFGHMGDGNLHYNVSYAQPDFNTKLLAQTDRVNAIVYDIVAELNGTLSAEHGIGQLKVAALAHYRSAVELDLMAQIKKAFDPQNTMNPGKVLTPRHDAKNHPL